MDRYFNTFFSNFTGYAQYFYREVIHPHWGNYFYWLIGISLVVYSLELILLNNPQMHIWHHSKELPVGSYGVNYGITLSLWDYLFGTVWMPHDGRDIELGFPNVENFPKGFWGQVVKPFGKV